MLPDLVALVTLSKATLPFTDDMVRFYEHAWPDAPPLVDVDRRGESLTFGVEGGRGAIWVVPYPVPWAYLGPLCTSSWLWPDAATALSDHQAHVSVGLLGQPIGRREQALLLTRLVATAAATTDATGVLWSPASLVVEASAFVGQAEAASEQRLPIFSWVDFRTHEEPDGSLTLVTTGLRAFGLMEIEVHGSRLERSNLLYLAAAVAERLIADETPLDADSTFRSPHGDARVLHAPSHWRPGEWVYRLET